MVRRQALAVRRAAVCLALGASLTALLSWRLAAPALHTDEITYMGKVLESLTQGSVLPVRESGEIFVNKPPLALWLMRASFAALGPSPFAARLPSVLAGVATALLIYLYAAAAFHDAVGVGAALLFALVPGLLTLHGLRSATPDALEILLVTGAVVCLELWRRGRRGWTLVCLVAAVAAASWVKSPFAGVVVVVTFLVSEPLARRAGRATPRFFVTLTLVAVAWLASFGLWLGTVKTYAPAETASKAVLRQQYLQRLRGLMSPGHVHGADFYWRCLGRDFGPLLLLPAGAALAAVLRRHPRRPKLPSEAVSLLVWALAVPALASVSASKLPWYIYLAYPAIVTLLALGAWRLADPAVRRRGWLPVVLMGAAVLALAWRLPAERIWPRPPRSPARLVALARAAAEDAEIRVRLAPGVRFGRGDRGREARFYVQSLLWTQESHRPAAAPCLLRLANKAPGGEAASVELLAKSRGSRALHLVDAAGCAPDLRRSLESMSPGG